jgi:hypothetical protein
MHARDVRTRAGIDLDSCNRDRLQTHTHAHTKTPTKKLKKTHLKNKWRQC